MHKCIQQIYTFKMTVNSFCPFAPYSAFLQKPNGKYRISMSQYTQVRAKSSHTFIAFKLDPLSRNNNNRTAMPTMTTAGSQIFAKTKHTAAKRESESVCFSFFYIGEEEEEEIFVSCVLLERVTRCLTNIMDCFN